MAEIDKRGIILFKGYLQEKPPKGSFAPPYSIKAEDLDHNFRRISISPQSDGHTVTFTDNGTIIKFNTQDVSIGGKTLRLIVVQ
jgi:hypothetical protein